MTRREDTVRGGLVYGVRLVSVFRAAIRARGGSMRCLPSHIFVALEYGEHDQHSGSADQKVPSNMMLTTKP